MLDIHEFFLEGGKQRRSHVLLHITEPTTPPEFVKGYFFALIELHGAATTHIQFVQELIDDIEAQYYSDEDATFEEILEATNRRTRQLVAGVERIHCVVGVVKQKHIQFSYHGNPFVFLFHEKSDGQRHPIAILDDADSSAQERLFSTLLQGALGEQDVFFVGTPGIGDAFSLRTLDEQLVVRSTKDVVTYVEQMLNKLSSGFSYGGIFFQLPSDAPSVSAAPSHAAESSIMPQQKKIASPPKRQSASPKVSEKQQKKIPSQPESNHRPRRSPSSHESIMQIILVALGKGLVGLGLFLFRLVKQFVIRLGRIVVGSIVILTNHGNNRHAAIGATKQWFFDKQRVFSSLPLFSKLLFFVTVVFALLFAGSIWYLRVEEQQALAIKQYTDLVESIVNKQDAADAAIIYGDDEKAITLLDEAKALITSLPQDTDSQIDKRGELLATLEVSLQKLQKIETVTPTLLATLPEDASAQLLAMLDETLVAFGPESTTAFQINALTGTTESLSHETIPTLRIATTPKENDAITFIHGDRDLAQFDIETNAITTKTVGYPDDNARIGAISIYNQRLYSVNTAASTITRHGKTATGFDKGTPWLKESADLSGARAIAIDGDVFVLTGSDILKFSAGRVQDFSITGLVPRLENPTALWTYNDVPYLYILEPTYKRLVVLSKDGTLVNQYTANEWNNPTGMIIDDTRGKAFVLDGNTIYSFEVE